MEVTQLQRCGGGKFTADEFDDEMISYAQFVTLFSGDKNVDLWFCSSPELSFFLFCLHLHKCEIWKVFLCPKFQ
jgi:hypothetical protein